MALLHKFCVWDVWSTFSKVFRDIRHKSEDRVFVILLMFEDNWQRNGNLDCFVEKIQMKQSINRRCLTPNISNNNNQYSDRHYFSRSWTRGKVGLKAMTWYEKECRILCSNRIAKLERAWVRSMWFASNKSSCAENGATSDFQFKLDPL